MRELYNALKATSTGEVLWQEPMKDHTTFKIGGPSDIMVIPNSIEDLRQVIKLIKEEAAKKFIEIPFMIIGAGSNLLVSDKGIRGVVIKINKSFSNITVKGTTLISEAGATLTAISRAAQNSGLTGLEFAVGIPGTVGGAMVMNAGAYGGEIKNVLKSAKVMDLKGNIKVLSNSDLHFGYRHSLFMEESLVALEATFSLEAGDKEEIAARMSELTKQRTSKQPINMPCAGSVFKRPPDNFVGPLVEKAGLKGYRIGGAEVSIKHAGFIVNVGGATCKDVVDLIKHIQDTIKEKFGVSLEPEVRVVGEL
ncbi:MAG: UDP-N-acetylmuramate dehydrogenase [Firmicutes bacterium]|nr:UDP-N-acetylmuramate dehydrogenase [Bacillota bacterium]MDD4263301.1 UDP-N-acetylmuramate dehydrogenase [Bacillota bacterium]MDD4694228.1 UDP-N-acetylmuramate dehydrogenase [Bacillota bacterium]